MTLTMKERIKITERDVRRRSSLAATMMILLGGCMVGPDYQRPPVATPDVFRGSPTPTPDAHSFADLKWFEVFKDEQLQELIRTALVQNYDLRDAVARVDAARANLESPERISIQTSGLGVDLVVFRCRGRDNLAFPAEPADTTLEPSSSIFSAMRSTSGAAAPGNGSRARRIVGYGLEPKNRDHHPGQRRGHRLFQPSRTGHGTRHCKKHFNHAR